MQKHTAPLQPNHPIYKVCTKSVWESIRNLNVWEGSPDDIRDGFIHFSAEHQLSGTLQKHFAGQFDLVLLSIDPAALGERLKWEPSRNGELFPHLYDSLPLKAVVDSRPLDANALGQTDGADKS